MGDIKGERQRLADAQSKEWSVFEQVGFRCDDHGQQIADGCRVVMYPCLGDYEVDITLPNGGCIGFDVPIAAITFKPAKSPQ